MDFDFEQLLREHKWPMGAAVAAALVITLLITLVARPWSTTREDEDRASARPGDHVLQAVRVAMQPDGSLTQIGDTVVISRTKAGQADSVSTVYDPAKVVDGLPVRVLTSYRTESGVGTDLSDIKGYTGRVTIDLTIDNLTAEPRQLRYDVAGRSRTSTAMVGAPLTVVASAALPGTDPSKIVINTADTVSGEETTNGVLSQSQNNTTQVQWATILAPPQLGATANLRLVVEAKDFTLPTFDLSVQPGLVTDPSVGALVDAAFNPKSSEEFELQSRTIKLIGDVNEVLARAGDTISKVRRNLQTTSKTLGDKTVNSLRSSTAQITKSLATSNDNIDALGDDLRSSLQSTRSETTARMAVTVSLLDEMLGDTSAPLPKPVIAGSGCEQKVAAPGEADSVYANLLAVVAQLDGYASATDACRVRLRNAILESIGPANPTDETCTNSSVTCSLAGVEAAFVAIAERFVQDGQKALAGLRPGSLDPLIASLDSLVAQLDAVVDDTNKILVPDPIATARPTLNEIARTLSDAEDSVTALTKVFDGIHQDALDRTTELKSMLDQNAELADEMCDLIGDGTEPGKLTDTLVEELRSYLATRSCPDRNGDTTALAPPAKYGAAMATRLKDQQTALDKIAAASDTKNKTQGAGLALTHLRVQIETASSMVDETVRALTKGDKLLQSKVDALRNTVQAAARRVQKLKTDVGGVKGDYEQVKNELDAALRQAGDNAKLSASRSVEPEIRRIVAQGQLDSQQVGEMFERSAAGLSAAADAIRADGADTLEEQHGILGGAKARADQALSDSTESALTEVSQDVTSATRDLDATKTLLIGDLNNVLRDLGNPKVRNSGVLGALSGSAREAGSADYQLALASEKGSAYAAVRGRDLGGVMLRQAQAESALERQADLPAFVVKLPPTTKHRTVYVFHLDGGQ